MDQEALERINSINQQLGASDQPFKLAVISMQDAELLEKNARYMTSDQFQTLVANIKRDGGLSSVPFCYLEGGKYRVLSGNHRVMAAKEAGLESILVMYTDRPLTRQEQVAVQLSHNAIEGMDDPIILKELWAEIDDVELKFYSGLDDKLLAQLDKVTIEPLAEVNLDYRAASFVFLPNEFDRLQSILQEALSMVTGQDVFLGRIEEFSRALDALEKVDASYNIHNSATALMIVLDVFEQHLTDLATGWEERTPKATEWVPIASVLGTDTVPVEVARMLKQALGRMMDSGEVTKKNLWQALEYWAADYLASG